MFAFNDQLISLAKLIVYWSPLWFPMVVLFICWMSERDSYKAKRDHYRYKRRLKRIKRG